MEAAIDSVYFYGLVKSGDVFNVVMSKNRHHLEVSLGGEEMKKGIIILVIVAIVGYFFLSELQNYMETPSPTPHPGSEPSPAYPILDFEEAHKLNSIE